MNIRLLYYCYTNPNHKALSLLYFDVIKQAEKLKSRDMKDER